MVRKIRKQSNYIGNQSEEITVSLFFLYLSFFAVVVVVVCVVVEDNRNHNVYTGK